MTQKQTSQLEIERKYLIRMPAPEALTAHSTHHITITQTYLLGTGGDRAIRVRRSECGGVVTYRLNEKRACTALIRQEREQELTAQEYEQALLRADPALRPLHKVRWCVPYAGHVLEIDVFPFWGDRALCEVELTAPDEAAALPAWVTVIRDVSADARYLNSALAGQIPDEPLEGASGATEVQEDD